MRFFAEAHPEKAEDGEGFGHYYVYIAGPMTDRPSYNFPAFFAVENALGRMTGRHLGCDHANGMNRENVVFNPARNDVDRHDLGHLSPADAGQWLLDHPAEFDLRVALGEDVAWISKYADAVVVLPGWQGSKGATAEVALARALGLQVWAFNPDDEGFSLIEPDEVAYPRQKVTWAPGNTAATVTGVRVFTAVSDETSGVFGVGVGDARTPESDEEEDGVKETDEDGWWTQPQCLDGDVVVSVESGEIRTTSSSGGQKGVKPARFDLIPVGPLKALAEHYGKGAEKYDNHQWRRGYEWSKSYAALQRHLTAWWDGEDIDAETGSNHMQAVAWHAFCLLEFIENYPEHDDRYKKGTP